MFGGVCVWLCVGGGGVRGWSQLKDFKWINGTLWRTTGAEYRRGPTRLHLQVKGKMEKERGEQSY